MITSEHIPQQPPPLESRTWIKRFAQIYFNGWTNTVLTLTFVAIFAAFVPPIFRWAVLDAAFPWQNIESCANVEGACWLPIGARIKLFVYGFYPEDQLWRVNLVFAAAIATLPLLLAHSVSMRLKLAYVLLVIPVVVVTLLYGGVFGLPRVSSNDFGGLIITIFLGLVGSILSLPLGILLALGRQSNRPVIRLACLAVIEVFRAMPVITWLFIAVLVLQLMMPRGSEMDKLIRVVLVLTFVSSASKAEIVRAGLGSIPRGQREAAEALGLGYWRTMGLVIMPQVMRISIPAFLVSFIGLFKDTSLVAIVGLFDFLAVGMATINSDDWGQNSLEVYLFVAAVYFVILFIISRFSLKIEDRLSQEKDFN